MNNTLEHNPNTANLIDIELLQPPLADSSDAWLIWLLTLLLLAFIFWGLRRLWQHPRLLIWRWQRCLQQAIPVQQVALRVYGWLQTRHLILPAELQNQLQQACFSESAPSADEFKRWLAQLRDWL
jgi:hypothetical protein